MEEILATETEERELNAAQAQLAKAERLAAASDRKTAADPASAPRPKRTNWFSDKRDAERAGSFLRLA